MICGGKGVSDAYYCKECTICEKDRDGCGSDDGLKVGGKAEGKEDTKDVAKVETQPKFEGKQMVMIIQPN